MNNPLMTEAELRLAISANMLHNRSLDKLVELFTEQSRAYAETVEKKVHSYVSELLSNDDDAEIDDVMSTVRAAFEAMRQTHKEGMK